MSIEDAGQSSPVGAMARFRRRRAGGLPAELVRQLHDAERLCDELAESGLALRFERPGAGASGDRVRAVLVDSEGRALRDVRLADVVSLRLG